MIRTSGRKIDSERERENVWEKTSHRTKLAYMYTSQVFEYGEKQNHEKLFPIKIILHSTNKITFMYNYDYGKIQREIGKQ